MMSVLCVHIVTLRFGKICNIFLFKILGLVKIMQKYQTLAKALVRYFFNYKQSADEMEV